MGDLDISTLVNLFDKCWDQVKLRELRECVGWGGVGWDESFILKESKLHGFDQVT
jgi:hypothetical protein